MTGVAWLGEVLDHPRRRQLLLLALWGVAGAYSLFWLPRGWVSYDEGLIAQSATRVLAGELPHRDFTEVYTGGLSYWNAMAMVLFGERLLAPRILLWMVFLGWVRVLWYVASSVARPTMALPFVALAVAWSVPCYSAALPSWYNLFLATFSAAALMRSIEDPRRRWLVAAGACAGLSVLFKIIGLWTVAAGLIALLYREQRTSADGAAARSGRSRGAGGVTWSGVVTLLLAGFVAATAAVVQGTRLDNFVQWILPLLLLVALLVRREWTVAMGDWRGRVAALMGLEGPFLAGALLPLALFAMFYLVQGALPEMAYGVLVRPRVRISKAHWGPDPAWKLLFAMPALALTLLPRERWRRGAEGVVVAALAGLVLVAGRRDPFFGGIWNSMVALAPAFLILGALRLGGPESARAATVGDDRRFVLYTAASCLALIQFPFAARNYFLYAAPLVAVSWLAAANTRDDRPTPGARALALGYLAFALWAIHPAFLRNMNGSFSMDRQWTPLPGPRAGITVRPGVAAMYDTLARIVEPSARGGYAYAGPDAPEVNFLTGTKNPTTTIFDFLDDSTGRADRIRQAIVRHDVHVAAINLFPDFSSLPPDELLPWFRQRFPHERQVGKFLVFWRE